MRKWILVFCGGVIGAFLRFSIQTLFTTSMMLWIVNITGSFVLGSINGYYERNEKSENFKIFFTTGLLGAFTTFSTFSDSWFQHLEVHRVTGLFYGFSMTFLCFFVAYVGYRLGRGKQ